MNAPPSPNPIDTGMIPLISVAGMIRLVKLAASIIPAANPSDALMTLDDTVLTKNTVVAPITFNAARKSPPKSASVRISKLLK